MPNQHRLNVIAKLDRRLVSTRGGTRHILLDLAAPKAPRPEADQRPPLNLALVIDASGSMDGGPLDAAKAAAAGLIDQMTARDRITLVTFADDIIVHADALAADAAGCARLAAEVNGLVTRGCTNLAGGWLEGADLEVADDGSFTVSLSRARRPGNWLPMQEDSSSLIVRQM